jgi:hypothetical protein
LEKQNLTTNLRNEFIRDICTNLLGRGVHYLKKSDRDSVAIQIITEYPHLKDQIGSGLVCLFQYIDKDITCQQQQQQGNHK